MTAPTGAGHHAATPRPTATGPERRRIFTPAIAAVRKQADFVVERAGILVVSGDHGTGRTTAVLDYLEHQAQPWHLLDLPPAPDVQLITRRLYRAIVGVDRLPLRDMEDDLAEALRAQPRIVALRHAERLTAQAAAQVQYLHDLPGTRCTLILIGNTDVGTAVRRDPLLQHAIVDTVMVRPLADRDLLRVVQDLDPLFLNADPRLLRAVDEKVCKGNLAIWTRFLDRAHWLISRTPARDASTGPLLDKKLAQLVIGHMNALPKARK